MADLITLLRNKQCKVKYNKEYDEKCSDEELLENVIELNCPCNNLTSLPSLPQVQELWCENNQLTSLPPLPLCTFLDCSKNKLTSLSPLPLCTELKCDNNPLPFSDLKSWKVAWKLSQKKN